MHSSSYVNFLCPLIYRHFYTFSQTVYWGGTELGWNEREGGRDGGRREGEWEESILNWFAWEALEIMPMGDELKWLLKEGNGRIFENPLSRKWVHLMKGREGMFSDRTLQQLGVRLPF